jgi:hypothetical protein
LLFWKRKNKTAIRNKNDDDGSSTTSTNNDKSMELEWRKSSSGGISYAIPTFDNSRRFQKPLALTLAWIITMDALDSLIGIETVEQEENEKSAGK